MRPIERIVAFAGIVLAIMLALGGRESAAVARGPAPDTFKLATIDAYGIIEKLMAKPELKKAREDLAAAWSSRASAVERELQDMEDRLKLLPKSSPQVDDAVKRTQEKQAEYQKIGQDRQQELEKLNSTQLIDAYRQVRDATDAVAARLGYTHVMCNRSFDRTLDTTTLAATLQELLARPLVKGVAADDITKQVATELKADQ